MCVVQPHAAVKVHESERDMHNLHTFEHRLICLYTWRQQAREKTQKIGRKCATSAPYFEKIRRKRATVAPYLAASSHRRSFTSTSSPSPGEIKDGEGEGVRPATIASIPIDNPISRLVCFINAMKVRSSLLF